MPSKEGADPTHELFQSPSATRRTMLAGLVLSPLASSGIAAGLAAPLPAAAETKRVFDARPLRVAMLIDEGATLIDFAGPWEILSSAVYSCAGFEVYSVAPTKAPISCDDGRGAAKGLTRSGLVVAPDYTFVEAPQPDILIVGGQDRNDDPIKHQWIQHVHQSAKLSASVCTGAFLLAKSGILDGEAATTNAAAYDDFEKQFPRIKLIRGVRFVESGRVATSTGLTAGMDLALRVVDRFYGREATEKLAKYEEWPSSAWKGG